MMMKFKEFRDYDDQLNMRAVDQLDFHIQKHPNTEVVGYTVNVFSNANNSERSYILVKYEEQDNEN
ncbi:hypothetical protein [Staphylococcus felis]|uniref:hypothetical protein n=1 Tax=Staphylococcus felis TaxID=46127 RepID=UPI00396720C1